MTYIQPVGEIGLVYNYFYKGDASYKHTGLFADKETQTNYFYNNSKKYTGYQYNKDRNVFLIADNVSNVSRFSYMWFNNNPQAANSVFESKTFYAFITGIKYINNTTTEITFEIDVMQTYLYDISVPPCLVEREHTLTDNIYEHIVPEGLQADDLVVVRETPVLFPRMLCGFILKCRLVNKAHASVEGAYKEFVESYLPPIFNTSTIKGTSLDVAGVPNTLYWYTGFPITVEDVTYYRNHEGYYNTQSLYYKDAEGNNITEPDDITQETWFTASYTLYDIVNGKLNRAGQEGSTSEDDIVAVYLYPDVGSDSAALYDGKRLGYNDGIAAKYISFDELADFIYLPSKEPYTPKNKKMYSYPFRCIECNNNQGQKTIFKYENFSGEGKSETGKRINFRLVANNTNPAVMVLTPMWYNGDTFAYDTSISYTGFPQPYYSGDSLTRYLQQNENKREAALLSSVISAGLSGVATVATQNPLPALYGASQLIGTMVSQEAQISDYRNTPAENYSVFNSDFLNVGIKYTGFVIKEKTLRADVAAVIDDYFTQYGYKISKIKRPNVFEYLIFPSTKIRPVFNYIKTKNCLVKNHLFDNMCDSTTLDKISKILDKGITFWCDVNNMGDYSLDNAPRID